MVYSCMAFSVEFVAPVKSASLISAKYLKGQKFIEFIEFIEFVEFVEFVELIGLIKFDDILKPVLMLGGSGFCLCLHSAVFQAG